MAKHTTLSSLFSATADAIRAKKGTTDPIIADNFPDEINGITGGGFEWKPLTYTPSADDEDFNDFSIEIKNDTLMVLIKQIYKGYDGTDNDVEYIIIHGDSYGVMETIVQASAIYAANTIGGIYDLTVKNNILHGLYSPIATDSKYALIPIA